MSTVQVQSQLTAINEFVFKSQLKRLAIERTQ